MPLREPGTAAYYNKHYTIVKLTKELYLRHRIRAPKATSDGRLKGLKGELIEMMLHANAAEDQRGPFRFFDLPPEMRNIVYSYLLTLGSGDLTPGKSNICHPEILASCKQAHYEAESILYGENRAEVTLESIYPTLAFRTTSDDQQVFHRFIGWRPRQLSKSELDWPTRLLRFQDILITCTLIWEPTPYILDRSVASSTVHNATNHLLYSLVSFLNTTKKTKKIEVRIVIKNFELDEDAMEETLWPLTQLTSGCELIITGVPDTLQKHVSSSRITDPSRATAVYQALLDMMEAAKQLVDIALSAELDTIGDINALWKQGRSLMLSTDRVGAAEATAMKSLLDAVNTVVTQKRIQEIFEQIAEARRTTRTLRMKKHIMSWMHELREE
ncbi:hypothetical protein HII31_07977 [Pseudocercospora fuligena]|uniref:Uncharacterized protein n=1 Tax=Pseudocercospora fuligena TaxID=685502 RepID=A0A8H6RGQ9_9PEZI|nr:hypothetical protein HII31_07977 [Pseudocercospora fuligena]